MKDRRGFTISDAAFMLAAYCVADEKATYQEPPKVMRRLYEFELDGAQYAFETIMSIPTSSDGVDFSSFEERAAECLRALGVPYRALEWLKGMVDGDPIMGFIGIASVLRIWLDADFFEVESKGGVK